MQDPLALLPERRIPRTSAAVPALILAFGLGLAAPALAGACPGARPGDASAAEVRRATLCLLNHERAQHGLRPLRHDGRLALAARRHAQDMVRRRYFAHDSLSGANFVDRIQRTGYTTGRRWRVGENLAWGAGAHAAPAAIVQSWMNSPGHRANVLGPFREIGVGLARGAPVDGFPDGATYATSFGARR